MPVDLAFELSYILSDKLGGNVEVKGYSYDGSTGMFCVEADVEGTVRRACVAVKQCKGLEGPRLERCLSKAVVSQERIVDELAEGLAK